MSAPLDNYIVPPDAQCREYITEMLGFVIVSAEIAQRYCETGDDVGLHYQLQRLVLHVRAATATYKDLAAIRDKEPQSESEAAA